MRTLLLLLVLLVPALAQTPGWAVGWGGLDPANKDSAGSLRQERDEARAQLARCLRSEGHDVALQGPQEKAWPTRGRTMREWGFLLGGAAFLVLGAFSTWILWPRRAPAVGGGKFLNIEPDLRAPLRGRRQAESRQWCSWAAQWCSRCRPMEVLVAWRQAAWRLLPRMPQSAQSCKCSGRLGFIASSLRTCASTLWSRCSSCATKTRKTLQRFCKSDDWDLEEEPGLDTPVLWRQRAQSARQALQKAQAELERCLAEASQRVEENRRKAEQVEAENGRLIKQVAEFKSRAEAAEQIARKWKGEAEQLKASLKKAEETSSKARQELQSARRRAEVAETIAARATRVRDARGDPEAQDRSTSRTRKLLDVEGGSQPGTPRVSPSPRPSPPKASSPSTSTKEKAGSQPGTPRQSAQDLSLGATRRPTAKARAGRLPTRGGGSTSSLANSLEEVTKDFRRSTSGPAGSTQQSAQQSAQDKAAPQEFRYNRALAMMKFTENRGGGSGVPSATSSMQSLPGRVEDALQGLAPAKSSKNSSSSAQRFTRVPRLSLDE